MKEMYVYERDGRVRERVRVSESVQGFEGYFRHIEDRIR